MKQKEELVNKMWTFPIERVESNGKEECVVSLPETFLQGIKWKAGDKLFWIFHPSREGISELGAYEVRRATKEELYHYKITEAEEQLDRENRIKNVNI